ncbi:hypothetical protein OHS18_13290 [Amycolatopsis sp. NBC_00355]|uniref:hypothetical protein n=1 Tax=Amycolatopsis sp. NBC_00355 TaxID=2975957 RepID=UPI002E2638EE
MGVLLRPTPNMGAWVVEMFTDRTCLRRRAPADTTASGAGAARSADAAQDDVTLPELDIDAVSPDRGFGFESADLEPVIATLDQVLDDPLYLDYIGRINVDLGRWIAPHAEDGWITIDGPVVDAATRVHDRTVELSYVHVAELRLKLVDFADALAADDTAW